MDNLLEQLRGAGWAQMEPSVDPHISLNINSAKSRLQVRTVLQRLYKHMHGWGPKQTQVYYVFCLFRALTHSEPIMRICIGEECRMLRCDVTYYCVLAHVTEKPVTCYGVMAHVTEKGVI